MTRTRRILFFCIVIAAVCAGTLIALEPRAGDTPDIAGFVYPEPKRISPFELTAHNGSGFNLAALQGKWTFVYFGYAHCPDACPTTLAELNRVQQLLAQAGLDGANQYVFVSVDGRRDTPQHLAAFVPFFNAKFIGVSGRDAELQQFTRQIGVIYVFPEGREGADYVVAHSSNVALFDPNARLHAVFTEPQRADEIVAGFRKILQRWR